MSPKTQKPTVAIIDFGMGNLFSVKHACNKVGLEAIITSSPHEISEASAAILPGVGAFGEAMATLKRLDLVEVIKEMGSSNRPLLGICLGMQLLMSESHEFGRHQGLGIVEGEVLRFEGPQKVPQIGWNQISLNGKPSWGHSLLNQINDGEYMYFVHSFYAKPLKQEVVVSTTRYGEKIFCSSLTQKNIFATQFHPERSGPEGLKIYQNFASLIKQ